MLFSNLLADTVLFRRGLSPRAVGASLVVVITSVVDGLGGPSAAGVVASRRCLLRRVSEAALRDTGGRIHVVVERTDDVEVGWMCDACWPVAVDAEVRGQGSPARCPVSSRARPRGVWPLAPAERRPC